jgi:tRNA dimethylallyltransferase
VEPALRAGLEARYDREGPAALHAELMRVDPRSGARLHPNDRKRVVRALEVWRQTGRPLSDWQREWGWGGAGDAASRPHRLVALTLDPAELERRIRARTRAMLAAGWAEEVRGLLAAGGLGPTARQALGYAEVIELVEGRLGGAEAAERIAVRTRRFARKQRTWLRHFPERVEVAAPRPGDAADMDRAARQTLAALGLEARPDRPGRGGA